MVVGACPKNSFSRPENRALFRRRLAEVFLSDFSGFVIYRAIAAVVLGGTSLFGGEGGMRNTVLGLLIFGVLSNGLNLLPNIPITFKQALQGLVLLAALLLNVFALRIAVSYTHLTLPTISSV